MRQLIIAAIGVLAIFVFLLLRGKRPTADRAPPPTSLTVCSFNIQFLGQSKVRDDQVLARILKDCDIAVIQELVAPPYVGRFPDGKPYKPDVEAAEFFAAMQALIYDSVNYRDIGLASEVSTEEREGKASNFHCAWTVGELLQALLASGLQLLHLGEEDEDDLWFWQGGEYKTNPRPELIDWRDNPLAGLPTWLTLVARKAG